MALIDSATIGTFYDVAVNQPDSLTLEKILDKVLPLSLLDINADQGSNVSKSVEAILALLSAKHPSWESYSSSVRHFDNSVTCGLVWTKNYYAYRCRTCAISQCLSLCEDCFKAGNHEGHDFNLFRSSSGGACDCGDPDVMRPLGFCCKHGEQNAAKLPSAPSELVATARAVLPRLLLLLTLHMRRNHAVSADDCISGAGWLFDLLKQMTDLGAGIHRILCDALTDERLYSASLSAPAAHSCHRRIYADSELDSDFASCHDNYTDAIGQLMSVLPDDGSVQLGGQPIVEGLRHRSLLDELTFWMVKAKFPQPLISLLLAALPIRAFKAPFAAAFSDHYLRLVSV
uniref:E3 ubiquitin-protein ligase n=1 Tax=Macrostomum lignano TaxID=282301 RepID=A0A1I8FWF7_9PLAT